MTATMYDFSKEADNRTPTLTFMNGKMHVGYIYTTFFEILLTG